MLLVEDAARNPHAQTGSLEYVIQLGLEVVDLVVSINGGTTY